MSAEIDLKKGKVLHEEITCSVMPNILTFRDEILLKIFQFVSDQTSLRNCRLVCKKWNSVGYDFTLWKKIKFRRCPPIKLSDVIRIISYGAEHLDFGDNSLITDYVDERLMKSCLEKIKLHSLIAFDSEVVSKLLTLSTQFHQLSIAVHSDQICKLIGLNKGLLKLDALFGWSSVYFGQVTPNGFRNIFLNCTQIQDLGLDFDLHSEDLPALLDLIPRSLKSFRFFNANERKVLNIINRCPTLIKLYFYRSKISSTMINKIASELPKIEELIFSSCWITSDETLQEPVFNTSLKTLVIKGEEIIHSPHIKLLCLYFPAIKKLSISESLSRDALDELSDFIPCSVTKLNFHSIWDLSDVVVKKILRRCSAVVELNIIGCVHVTSAVVQFIKEFTNIEKLTLPTSIPLNSLYILQDLRTLKELYLDRMQCNESSPKQMYFELIELKQPYLHRMQCNESSLKELYLDRMPCDESSLKSLIDTLKYVRIYHNKIAHDDEISYNDDDSRFFR